MLVVVSGAMLLGFAALAIDVGSIFLQTRKLQGMADLAGPVTADAVKGVYPPDPAIAPASRFVAGASDPNAVRVTLRAEADLFFGQAILGRSTTSISRTATAAKADLAAFSIGARFASLNGGVANSLLTGPDR